MHMTETCVNVNSLFIKIIAGYKKPEEKVKW